jgi:hypothetical protein
MLTEFPPSRRTFALKQEADVVAYWRALEELFCGKREHDKHGAKTSFASVFPAAVVTKVLTKSAWCTSRLMTTTQRVSLYTRINQVRN